MNKERLDNIIGILGNFLDFSKRLAEIAKENDVPYEEIWECWKEQRNTAGTNTRADFHKEG